MSARDHHLYRQAAPDPRDGLFHCPWEGRDGCNHRPEKLKCNYDKFVDSHLKPYRCKFESCEHEDLRFSSTACLLRHEREAHALHGYGEKPYLCTIEGCERAAPGNGFPRQWNLKDHMKRVHNEVPMPPSPALSASPPGQIARAYGQPQLSRRKRKEVDVGSKKTRTLYRTPAISAAATSPKLGGSCSGAHFRAALARFKQMAGHDVPESHIDDRFAVATPASEYSQPNASDLFADIGSAPPRPADDIAHQREQQQHVADLEIPPTSTMPPPPAHPVDEGRKFACPFFKKNPQRYQHWRSCPGPGWTSVHRVKEHLYRSHSLPITCPRCHEEFKSEAEKATHLTADQRCELNKDEAAAEGVDSKTQLSLKSRKRGNKRLSEAEKWADMFLILFPGTADADVPTPYYEPPAGFPGSEELVRFGHFLRRELPDRIGQQLEGLVEEKTLRAQITDIMLNLQLDLFKQYTADRTKAKDSNRDGDLATATAATTIPSSVNTNSRSLAGDSSTNTSNKRDRYGKLVGFSDSGEEGEEGSSSACRPGEFEALDMSLHIDWAAWDRTGIDLDSDFDLGSCNFLDVESDSFTGQPLSHQGDDADSGDVDSEW